MGKALICCTISIIICAIIIKIYNVSVTKVNRENEENKGKSLHFFIDR